MGIIDPMSEVSNNGENNIERPESVSFDPAPNTEFLREKIKQKPINKKKLIKRTLISVSSAAIFGVVATLTFLILEPVISDRLSRNTQDTGEEINIITLTEESEDDEILPEDMYATDTEMIEEVIQGNVENVNQNIQNIETMVSKIHFGIDDYQNLYAELRTLADETARALVTVRGVTSETDIFDNIHRNSAQRSGLIVADNGPGLLVLVKDVGLTDAEELSVVFKNGWSCRAQVLGKDDTTGYMIVMVRKAEMDEDALSLVKPASLGTSRSSTLKGTPVMALGAPLGISESTTYGMVISDTSQLSITDGDYTIFTTDMVGNDVSSGVVVSLRGNVIGIIDNTYVDSSSNGMINAIGITELKPLIEKLSNSEERAYLGVQGIDITRQMQRNYDLPEGVYINNIEMDSPAMRAGLQNGDILVRVNEESINTYHDFILWLVKAEPESDVKLTIKRQSVSSYTTLSINVTLGTVKSSLPKE